MPDESLPAGADGIDYKKKYKALKRKLRFLIYEQECFQEELRRAQRKLLKASRDKSFLLDRLLHYEKTDEEDSDSDATASSSNASDNEISRNEEEKKTKKRKKTTITPQLSNLSSAETVPTSLATTAGSQVALTGQHISDMIGNTFAQQTNSNRLASSPSNATHPVLPIGPVDAQSSPHLISQVAADRTNPLIKLSQSDSKPPRKKSKRDYDRLNKMTNSTSPPLSTDETLETSDLVIDLPE